MEIEQQLFSLGQSFLSGENKRFYPFYEVYSFQSVALIYSDSIYKERRLPLVDCIIVPTIHSSSL